MVSPKADKIYVDGQLALKANQLTTYTKTEVDTELGLKADQSITYTKTEVDSALGLKVDQVTTYTIAPVDTALGLKANQSTTYTKAEVQQLFLNLIDNAPASLDTLNELANALANDANFATNIQNQIALKSSITYVDGQLALKADQLTTYTKRR